MSPDPSDLKRRVRALKKLEVRIRFGDYGTDRGSRELIWDRFFDLGNDNAPGRKHTLDALSALSREEYKQIVDEYFARVYYELYRERGLAPALGVYDPDLLARLGLPFDAGRAEIVAAFRERAKLLHPDQGGNAEEFIALMEDYRRLIPS